MGKTKFREKYPTLRSFLKGKPAKPAMGELFIPKTNIFAHREWKGVEDSAVAFGWWLLTWGKMAGFVLRDPVRMARAFWNYRWLSAYLVTPHMVDEWTLGDRGSALRGLRIYQNNALYLQFYF